MQEYDNEKRYISLIPNYKWKVSFWFFFWGFIEERERERERERISIKEAISSSQDHFTRDGLSRRVQRMEFTLECIPREPLVYSYVPSEKTFSKCYCSFFLILFHIIMSILFLHLSLS